MLWELASAEATSFHTDEGEATVPAKASWETAQV